MPDTLKEKYAWTISLGNYAKAGLGTTFLGFGYSPNRHLDFFVAPSWGIFTGGTAIFLGSKFNVFSKRKLLFNAELTYRHSSSTVVIYENFNTGGQESYYIPPSDYILTGIGINYRTTNKQNESSLMVFNVTINYNLELGNKHFKYLSGPFSKEGKNSARRKLAGGFGFSISFTTQLWRNKKKSQ